MERQEWNKNKVKIYWWRGVGEKLRRKEIERKLISKRGEAVKEYKQKNGGNGGNVASLLCHGRERKKEKTRDDLSLQMTDQTERDTC